MKGNFKCAAALLVLFALTIGICISSWAAPLDLTMEDCSITVDFDNDRNDPLDLVVDIYRIADVEKVDGFDTYTFVPKDLYSGLNFNGDDWDGLAYEAAALALRNNEEADPKGAAFGARIGNLSTGLYLVIARGADLENYMEFSTVNGKEIVVTLADVKDDSGTVYKFAPALVALPTQSDGEWYYDMTAKVKPDQITENDNDRITLSKVDAEHPDVFLPGAKFELYSAEPVTSEREPRTVYVEGKGEVKLYFQPATGTGADDEGRYITGDDGTVELQIPNQPDTLFALVEVEAPAGYRLPDKPYYFMTEGDATAGADRVGVITDYDPDAGDYVFEETAVVLTGSAITIENDLYIADLPESGGIGTAAFYIAGSILLAGVPVLYGIRKRIRL